MVSVFRGVPPSPWLLAALLLASCWLLAGVLLASCWLLPGLLLASWLLASFKLRHEDFSRKSVFQKALKFVNSLHENACFSMISVSRGASPFGASSWPLPSLLLASCWPLAGLFLASCWLPRQSILAKHPAKAPRQSIPPEHPRGEKQKPSLIGGLGGRYPKP